MTYIKTQRFTPSQARELTHLGFVLELVQLLCGEWDEYRVFVR